MKRISPNKIKRSVLITPLLLLVTLFGSAMVTNADTINFNSFEQSGSSLVHIGDPYFEAGYRIQNGGELWFAQQSHFSYAGSAGLHERIANGLITLQRADGSTFALTSIDLSVLSPGGASPPVVFTGVLSGGGTVTQTFTPTLFGFHTFTFNGSFTNLVSVSWRQGSEVMQAHEFDNIVVNSSVPEPASMILLGSGLIALGGVARRRMRSK